MEPDTPYQNTALSRQLLDVLHRQMDRLGRPVRFMEVCGTHTVSLFRSGVRSLLPAGLHHVTGPGCPVCVTHDRELAAIMELAQQPDVVLASFGDMLRVPGPDGRSLKHAQATGARIETVYSPLDAVQLAAELAGARAGSGKTPLVVFVGVGFETTAPTVAAAVLTAHARGVDNFCVFSCHKRVPPALQMLLQDEGTEAPGIDALLLPGHVATVLGLAPFAFVADTFHRPAVIAGFEPADMLGALDILLQQLQQGTASVINAYGRAVGLGGNARARAVLDQVFEPVDAAWRGLGMIPLGGLAVRQAWARYDVMVRLGLHVPDVRSTPGCRCGDVLRGRLTPPECPLFGTVCTPAAPVGPCMVSTEGSCAAWQAYGS